MNKQNSFVHLRFIPHRVLDSLGDNYFTTNRLSLFFNLKRNLETISLSIRNIMLHKLYQIYLEYRNISTDTRTLQKGDIFFALKGDSFNGNKFAEKALKSGANYAVIDEKKYQKDERYILTENALQTLQQLAQLHRQNLIIPFLALTGSNGKTTTKELLRKVLETKFRVHATKGNLNNHIGVPLTILSLPKDTELAIIEMGANKIGDINELCQIAQPSHGLITNIGHAHLEGFGGFEGVLRGKTELYDFLLKNSGTVFINSEDDILSNMAHRFSSNKGQLYGAKSNFQHLELVQSQPFVKIKTKTGMIYETSLTGKYNFSNMQTAQAVGTFFDIPIEQICQAIASYIPENNRSQVVFGKTNQILADAYNANPSSMKLTIENFAQLNDKYKIVILGDMFELGKYALEKHQEIVDYVAKTPIDLALFCGENFAQTIPKTLSNQKSLNFKTKAELTKWIQANPPENASILLKGSRGMALESLLSILK